MGRNFASFSIYVALGFFHFAAAVEFHQPKLLPDGLLVTGGSTDRSIRNVVGTWSLHVIVEVLDPPSDRLQTQVQQLSEIIASLPFSLRADNDTKEVWLRRLRFIADQLPRFVTPHERHKRGLLDAGGMVLHQLFGVATSGDVATSRQLIRQVRDSNKQILHKANELVSVVNQTYNELSLHRTHLLDIEISVTQLYRQVNTLKRVSAIRFERMRSFSSIDRSLAMLQSQQLFWHRQRDQYLQERDALEKGRLTEAIMPISELENIVQACHEKGFYVPRVEWLYEFVTIRPMWQSNDVLVYTASLPLTDNNEYLRYHIYTWPSVPDLANFTIEIEAPTDIAYDTVSGSMYIPSSCIGRYPEVCETGPLFNKAGLTCPRGILTNDETLRKTCHITIRNAVGRTTTQLERLSANVYVICSLGERYDILCPGEPSNYGFLPSGVSRLQVKPGCSLAGDTWMLTCIMLHNINISLHMHATVETAPFNWSRLISHRLVRRTLQTPLWSALPEIKHVQLSLLRDDSEATEWIPESDQSAVHLWWLFLFVCGLPMGIGILVLVAHRRKWWCFHIAPVPSRSRSADSVSSPQHTFEMVPLNTQDCVSAIQAHLDVVTMPTE